MYQLGRSFGQVGEQKYSYYFFVVFQPNGHLYLTVLVEIDEEKVDASAVLQDCDKASGLALPSETPAHPRWRCVASY